MLPPLKNTNLINAVYTVHLQIQPKKLTEILIFSFEILIFEMWKSDKNRTKTATFSKVFNSSGFERNEINRNKQN